MLIPKTVLFDFNDRAICVAGMRSVGCREKTAYAIVIDLPGDDDSIALNVRGKTAEQIRKEVREAQCPCGDCKGCTGAACESD